LSNTNPTKNRGEFSFDFFFYTVRYLRCNYYRWIDNTADGLIVPGGIIDNTADGLIVPGGIIDNTADGLIFPGVSSITLLMDL
jgi:hypothetical protein